MRKLKVKIIKLHKDAAMPVYRHDGDSGFDLACVEDTTIPANAVKILPTGLAMAIPEGFELQLRLRSSAALKTPLIIPNAPATIDAGYRGEIGIIVRNMAESALVVHKGERIAQGVIAPVLQAQFERCDSLPPSDRGEGGYGSTGN